MVDKARRIFGRKAVAKRGRFGHQIVVVFLPERLQVQYLADVSAPRGGKADAGAAFSCGHRLPVSSPTPCLRSEEHTSELQSLMRISYAVFCLKKKQITEH